MSNARRRPLDEPAPVLLDVGDLSVSFVLGGAALGAVNGVDFQLRPGETLCLLGESGSGKTVTMRALIRLLPATAQISGRIKLDMQPLDFRVAVEVMVVLLV